MKFHVWFLVVFKDKDNKRINIAELQLRIRKISRVLTVLFSQDKNIKSQAPKNDENKRTKDDSRTRHKKVWEDFEMKIIFLAISMRDRLAAFETEAPSDQLTVIKSPD